MHITLIMLHKYTYIVYNQLLITVDTSLFIILLQSRITCTTARLKLLSLTVSGKDLNMNPLKIHTVSLLYMFPQNIFISEKNNYAESILQSHTSFPYLYGYELEKTNH